MKNGQIAVIVVCCCLLSGCNRASRESAGPTSFRISPPIGHVEFLAREPMVVQHPNGTMFVAGYGSPVPHLWRSSDDGATWTLVDVGGEAIGAIGNSDVDLAIAPDGTLYFIVMSYDRKKFEGTGIAMGASTDAGASWTWTQLSKTRYDDRPWVEVTPDGVAHAIWNDGAGVSYAVSRDRGRTWSERPRINAQGHSSHLAVGPAGEVAVRITPVSASMNMEHKGVDLVAVSADGGETWTKHDAPGERQFPYPPTDAEDPMPRWVEPVAWDGAGHLYYLWTDPAGLWLARSTDRGAQWTTWKILEGGALRYFPYLAARGKGELAATWFSGRGVNITAHAARIDVGDVGPPRLIEAEPFAPDTWRFGEKPGAVRGRDTAGEYFPIAFLRNGRFGIVSTIQDDQNKRFGFAWRVAELR
jgi:hypothetical protein